MTSEQNILQEIKSAVGSVDKDADVILFGSRARGDQKDDSDWDLLILTDKTVNTAATMDFLGAIIDVEVKYRIGISSLVRNRGDWERRSNTDLFANIQREGVYL